eukprot:NODE_3293_length_791_cov_24.512129_g2750_i0.p1 GENE.NODE_3293_length_791_cov_24.512129_g2750_i0~~NODE_3293_length_791_cov_24.512129_g2750_i0.p1  ORF type:complete len:143 (+),score=20.17 NODE_3293_length_791_cov_24.512129_g2750_i0:306-734(+)
MWLQRYAKMNYTRKLSYVLQRESNLTINSLRTFRAEENQNCDKRCSSEGLACRGDALSWSSLNSCWGISRHMNISCKICRTGEARSHTPSSHVENHECYVNYLHDKLHLPLCNASAVGIMRLCPCVPHAALQENPYILGSTM